MDSSDVEVEMDYHLLRRIKDKALNLSARLTKSARADREARGCDMQLVTPEELGCRTVTYPVQLPNESLADRLKLVADV
jgi:hypothetical protein